MSIENRDPPHRRPARRKTNSISDIVIKNVLLQEVFPKKELNSASGKKKHKKKACMESNTVMLINSVLTTTLILLHVKI